MATRTSRTRKAAPAKPEAEQEAARTLAALLGLPGCGCGCEAEVKKGREFKQGHDQRLRGLLTKAHQAGDVRAAGVAKARGWVLTEAKPKKAKAEPEAKAE